MRYFYLIPKIIFDYNLVEKQFTEMIENMCSSTSWSLKQWKSTLESQLSGWMSYISVLSRSSEMDQLKKFKSIYHLLMADLI